MKQLEMMYKELELEGADRIFGHEEKYFSPLLFRVEIWLYYHILSNSNNPENHASYRRGLRRYR